MLDFSVFKGKKLYCAGLGEVLFDTYDTGVKIGGAPANFAYHCMQNGLNAVAVSSVGNDALGFLARDLLASKFLPALLISNDRPTGAVNVSLDENGQPTYSFLDNTAYDSLSFTEEMKSVSSIIDMVCFGTLCQRAAKSHETVIAFLLNMKKDSVKVFDVNLRGSFYSKDVISASLEYTDIFKCNEDELPVLCKMADLKDVSAKSYYEYLKTRGVDCFVFTEGAKQSTVFLGNTVSVKSSPKIQTTDTVGAGDSFTATLVSQLMLGRDLSIAHERAVKVAAYVCTQEGAMPQLPQDLVS
ncbi:MAG: PfkB family carbohydrate kinase [Succinivibrio sp.]